jgi:hypothetical protein
MQCAKHKDTNQKNADNNNKTIYLFTHLKKPHLTPQQQFFVNSSRKVATSLLSGNNPLQPNPAAKGPIPIFVTRRPMRS